MSDSGLFSGSGMTLRDYFAAQALAAIIARSTNHAGAIMPRYSNGSPVDRSEFADTAYQYADAMLKERAK